MTFIKDSVQSDRPVSISELKKFMKCRLLWYFSAAPPRAMGLTPKFLEADALVFGRLAHAVLEDGYNSDRNFNLLSTFRLHSSYPLNITLPVSNVLLKEPI